MIKRLANFLQDSFFARFRQSEFSKNTAIVFIGSVLSQLILVAATPWLSRIYSPEAFGLYGVFISLSSITGLIATLRYTQAIIITDTKEQGYNMLLTCIGLSVLFCLIVFLVLWGFLPFFLNAFNTELLGYSLLLMPFYAALLGINESLFVWLNRNKAYKHISFNRITTAFITLVVALLWGYVVDRSALGLIAGSILGQVVGTALLLYRGNRLKDFSGSFTLQNAGTLMKQYRHFAFFTLPSDFINVLTNQLPILMLNRLGTSTEAGHYNMAYRILGLPTTFVSMAIAEVFKQRSAEDYQRTGTCRPIFLKTLKFLSLMGIPVFAVIALFGPALFALVLGEEWKETGEFARILALLFCFKFIVSPLTVTFFVAQKQRMDFYIHVLMFIFAAVPFYLGYYIFQDAFYSLLIYSVAYSLIYILYLYLSLKYATKEHDQIKTII